MLSLLPSQRGPSSPHPRHTLEMGHLGQVEAILHCNRLLSLPIPCPHPHSLTPPCIFFPDSG